MANLDLIAMATDKAGLGPVAAIASLLDDMRDPADEAAASYNLGDAVPVAAIGPDTYAAEILSQGEGEWLHTGHWRDNRGALCADDYLAARAILAVRPGLTDAEIQADAEAQIAAGNDPSTVREDAYSLTYYLTYWSQG